MVSGRVQGVGFRISLVRRATAAGVAGWVRNQPDGRVEAVFEGDGPAVDGVLAWCGSGPRGAEVTSIEVVEEPPRGERGFAVR